MEYLRIKNLRSIRDSGKIRLAPITVLVGENSSGKSTFLRTFPLFRQSAESRTLGPILWYGNLVDFGDFNEARSRGSNQKFIEFEFGMKISSVTFAEVRLDIRKYRRMRADPGEQLDVVFGIELEQTSQEEVARLRRLYTHVLDHTIEIQFSLEGDIRRLDVNGQDITKLAGNIISYQRDGLLPSLRYRQPLHERNLHDERGNPLANVLFSEIKRLAHNNTSDSRVEKIINGLRIGSSEEILHSINANPAATKRFEENTSDWSTEHPDFCYLRDILVAIGFLGLYDECEMYVSQFARNVNYLAPLRASAERYYRLQGLAVNEVDYQGQNLAMFLRNLSVRLRNSFDNWLEQHFGFVAETRFEGGHIALFLRESNSEEVFNLTDMGFGFSQLLPVVTQLWLITQRVVPPSRSMPITIAIEQPELHLHPRLQAKMADVFLATVKSAREAQIDLRIILETHSQAIVNRLGSRIATGDINPEDVNVVLFEKGVAEMASTIRTSSYDIEGYLVNWPYGFFEPDSV